MFIHLGLQETSPHLTVKTPMGFWWIFPWNSAQDWLFLLHKGPLPLATALREARSESEGRLPTLLRAKKEESGPRMPLGSKEMEEFVDFWDYDHYSDLMSDICIYIYAQRLGFAQALQRRGSTLGRSTKVLGNIKVPPPLNFTFIEDLQYELKSLTLVKLLHSLKIFDNGVTLPPPFNF